MSLRKNGFDKKYIIQYTGIFTVFCIAMFFPFLILKKGLVWKTDGASQYVPYLIYMGRYLREFVRNLLQGRPTLKMYDFILGMGDDVGAVFRSHPLDFLSIAVPGRYTEYLYHFLTVFRMYLAGLSISAFGFYWKKPGWGVRLGSLVYIFCGYVMMMGLRHPTFLSPMIILPVFLIGAEQVMRKQNVLLFSFMTGLGFISNYYLMYMCSVAMAVYVLLRFFDLYREKRPKNFFLTGIRLAAAYLLGMGLAAVIFFPTLARLFSSYRLGNADRGNLLHYSIDRYYKWFMDLISPYRMDSMNLNYVVLVFPVLVLLFVRGWREHLTLKIAVLLEFAGIFIPAVTFVLTNNVGHTYRWTFLLSFTLGAACMSVAEDFKEINRKQAVGMLALLLIYCAGALRFPSRYWYYAAAELAVCVTVLLILRIKPVSAKTWESVLVLITACSVAVNSYFMYTPGYGGRAGGYLQINRAYTYLANSKWSSYNRISDDDFYRVDSDMVTAGKENASVVLGYQGISMYNSVVNSNLIQYLLDQGSAGINAIHRIFSLDGRAASEALANVKYFLAKTGEEKSVPYGFRLREDLSDETYRIYQNELPLSIGYTYDTYISYRNYEQLDDLEKQQVMLEAVVLEDGSDADGLEQTEAGQDEIITIPAQNIRMDSEISATADGYRVEKTQSSIYIPYEKREGYECYLQLKGLYRNITHSRVDIVAPGVNKHITVRGSGATYSLNREDYLIHLGYAARTENDEVRIRFRYKGSYKLDKINLCYVPLGRYEENVSRLNQDALEEVSVSENTVSGHVTLEQQKFMVFSIPYSEGWTAFVDGEAVKPEKANVMYMGVMLTPGEHEITLKYVTPGIRLGALASGISWLVFLVSLAVWRRKRRKTARANAR